MLKKIAQMIGVRPGLRQAPGPARQMPPGLRVYAIGDIHGRADLLEQLLTLIERDMAVHATDAQIQHIFLGDYVDRGADSAKVIDRLIALKVQLPQTVCLAGNHEDILSAILRAQSDEKTFDNWLGYGGRETLASYGVPSRLLYSDDLDALGEAVRTAVPPAHRAFLDALDISVTHGDYHFVHAGIHPARAIADQRPQDCMWIREPFLSYDRPLEKMVVHGHSIARSVEQMVHRIGIDTGAYATGRLTALALEGSTRRFIDTSSTS